jgi:hypothetical protein
MSNKLVMVLCAAIAFVGASPALAAHKNGHPNAKAAFAQSVASSSSGARAQVRRTTSSDFERIWFRAAEGPEWN